jgi:hypothetical protein
VGGIRPSETVQRAFVKLFRQRFEIIWRYHAVAVEEYEEVAFGPLHAVIPGYRTPFIWLVVVMGVNLAFIAFDHIFAGLA